MRLELADCERVLLQEIADRRFKRNHVAMTYRLALASSDEPDWARVNEAIVERWSVSGLQWIKKRAWGEKK